jgi:hypothetical protein
MTPQPVVIAGQQLKLLGLSRVGLQRSQMRMIGSKKFRQHISIEGIALGLAHAKPIPGPVQGLGINRIDHHPMIQQKIHNPPVWLFDTGPKFDALCPTLMEPAAKLAQAFHALLDGHLGYFLALVIADPHLVKLVGPIHSQIISLQLLCLLVCFLPIPSALNGKFALYRSSPKGQLSIELQLRSLAGRDSLLQILRGNWLGWVLIPASS